MAGRQSGKTLAGIAEICIDAMAHPGHVDWWICPTYEVKARVWRGLMDFLPPDTYDPQHGGKKLDAQRYVRLVNGSEIWVKSAAGDDSLVSESLDFAVCDEAGQWKEDAWQRGVSPMFAARPNSRVLLIGTPRGKNWFHRLWLKGRPGPEKDPDIESFHWRTADSPHVSQKYLESERANLRADTFAQEYEADPLDNALSAFRHFKHCIRNIPAEVDPFMVLGVDLARKVDFTAIVALNGRKQVTEVVRFQHDWPEQKQMLSAMAFRLNNARMLIEEDNRGDIFVQELRQAGFQVEGYPIGGGPKYNLINNLILDFEQSRISIPNNLELIEELEAYEIEYDEDTRKYKYGAPEGKHDDMVIALALAAWAQRGVPVYMTQHDRPSR
jgi:hypothetical protein